jgi:MFS family permease
MLLGAGIAATYMPGLRLLSDRVAGPSQSRYIAFYTSSFGIGIALSLALAGAIAPLAGWRAAFVASAVGPLVAGPVVLLGLRATPPPGAARAASLRDLFPIRAWRQVLAERAVAGYTLGYAAHAMELFGSRSWMVAFLVFSASLHAAGQSFPWSAATIAAVANLVSVSASILGNEVALRIGRRPWIVIAMTASGTSGILLALSAPWHWAIVVALLVAYSMLVMAESATLTAGLVAAVPAELRGAAMGLYSLAGFGGGLVGPVVFGVALDAAGGAQSRAAWVVAYAAIGAACLAAPLVTRLRGRG